MLEAMIFGTTFFIVLLSEIFDKTQFLIFGLALKYKSRAGVYWGALGAHVVMDLMAILFGALVVPTFFHQKSIVVAVAFLFIGVGTYFAFFEKGAKKKFKFKFKSPFLIAFATIFISEFGDKTQAATGLLAAQYGDIIWVTLGTLVALAIAMGFSIFIAADAIKNFIEDKDYLQKLSGYLFIVYGIGALLVLYWPIISSLI